MGSKLTQKENLAFWEKNSDKNTGHEVSWWDVNMKQLEVDELSKHLCKEDEVLDIGCSNGASTLDIYKKVGCSIHGFDYSEKAIDTASKIDEPNLSFENMSLLDLDEVAKYDKAYSIRCLINLMSVDDQKQALKNIHRALKVGGIYLMAEAFKGGLAELNKARSLFGLELMEEPIYNNYFDENELMVFLEDYYDIIEISNYASIYYLGTRVLQTMMVDGVVNQTDTDIHRLFRKYSRETANSGEFSPQKLFVLKKK